MKKNINLGLIGLSHGNGHPYSWSAIFNGYDKSKMKSSGYPAISNYLKKQKFPDDQIKGGKVTHIWTQDLNLSKQIASAVLIDNIVNDYHDLIQKVDAILLARDDAENHYEFAESFLKAGIPIYIDKPLALTVSDAKKIINLQCYEGQLFSCSAMKYSSELKLSEEQKNIVGEIRSVHGYVQKSWDKYAVHIIEPVLQLIPNRGELVNSKIQRSNDKVLLVANFKSGIDIHLQSSGEPTIPISLHITGTKGKVTLIFTDTFRAFHSTLKNFMEGIINKDIRTPPEDMIEVVRLVELGRK